MQVIFSCSTNADNLQMITTAMGLRFNELQNSNRLKLVDMICMQLGSL